LRAQHIAWYEQAVNPRPGGAFTFARPSAGFACLMTLATSVLPASAVDQFQPAAPELSFGGDVASEPQRRDGRLDTFRRLAAARTLATQFAAQSLASRHL